MSAAPADGWGGIGGWPVFGTIHLSADAYHAHRSYHAHSSDHICLVNPSTNRCSECPPEDRVAEGDERFMDIFPDGGVTGRVVTSASPIPVAEGDDERGDDERGDGPYCARRFIPTACATDDCSYPSCLFPRCLDHGWGDRRREHEHSGLGVHPVSRVLGQLRDRESSVLGGLPVPRPNLAVRQWLARAGRRLSALDPGRDGPQAVQPAGVEPVEHEDRVRAVER